MSTDTDLKAYIDRVLRLKQEQDQLGQDIRDVYAEAKSAGFDKTIMGKLVAHLRKVLKEGDLAVSEQEDVFGTYLLAYNRASGMALATHAHEGKYDPITGEVFESAAAPKLIKTIVDGVQTEIGRKALITALDIMIENEDQISGGCEPTVVKPMAALGSEESAASNSDHEAVAPVATALPSAERVTPHRSGSVAANIGGDHVSLEPPAATHQAGAIVGNSAPAINERCQNVGGCPFSHHPNKITCSPCQKAWESRKAAVPA